MMRGTFLLCAVLLSASMDAEPRRHVSRSSLEPVSDVPARVRHEFELLLDLKDSVGEHVSPADVVATGCSDIAATLSCTANTYNGVISSSDCLLESNSFVEFSTFQPTGTTPFTINLTTTSSRTFLLTIQRASDGAVVASDFGTSSISVSYTPPTSAQLFVGVGIVESFGTGSFRLTISCESGGGDCVRTALVDGQRVVGSLSSTDCKGGNYYQDVYTVAVRKGETLNLDLTSEFKGYVLLSETTSGVESGTYITSEGTGTLKPTFTPSADGTVTILISSYDENATGGYTLDLAIEHLPTCRQRAVRHR